MPAASRSASFWVENASIEWNEAEAPFHTVGRLTLEAASVLPDDACNAMHIDVTENALPENRPIGSINRARWAAESASRNARRGLAPPVSPPPAPRRSRSAFGAAGASPPNWSAGSVLAVAGAGCSARPAAVGVDRVLHPDRSRRAAGRGERDRRLPGSGLGRRRRCGRGRQTYYYTPQGASMKDLRYQLVPQPRNAAEQDAASPIPEVMRRYGFVVDEKSRPQSRSTAGRLRQGLRPRPQRRAARHHLRGLPHRADQRHAQRPHDGAAHRRRLGAARVHQSNIGHFVPTLLSSMLATAANPMKFRRFANNVLGEGTRRAPGAAPRRCVSVIGKCWRRRTPKRHLGLVPTEEGYGRTDALARIANTVFGDNLDATNYRHRQRAGELSAGVEHLEVRLGAVQRLGEPADGPQHRRVDGHRREVRAGRSLRQSASARRAVPLVGDAREPPHDRADAAQAAAAGLEGGRARPDRSGEGRARQGAVQRSTASRCHGPFVAPPAIKALQRAAQDGRASPSGS